MIWILVFVVLIIAGVIGDMYINDKRSEKELKVIRKEMAEKEAYRNKMYSPVYTRDLNKYTKGAIISVDLLNEITDATMRGESIIHVKKSVLEDMENRYQKHIARYGQ